MAGRAAAFCERDRQLNEMPVSDRETLEGLTQFRGNDLVLATGKPKDAPQISLSRPDAYLCSRLAISV